jgi:hypothetical protein
MNDRFSATPEAYYESFFSVPMMCEGLAAMINVQHTQPKFHIRRDIQLELMIGSFVVAEVELVRMESTMAALAGAPPNSTIKARIS